METESEKEFIYCTVVSKNFKNLERVKLTDLSLSITTDQLKSEVAKHALIPNEDYAVIFQGKWLKESEMLEPNGVTYGMTIHLVPKPLSLPHSVPPTVEHSEVGLEHLAFTLKSAMRRTAFRSFFQTFTKPNVFENIIASTPGLADDPVAVAYLQDADILAQFTELANLQKAAEKHPALVEGISYVVANIFDSNSQTGPSGFGSDSSTPFAYSYLMDGSDDDDPPSQNDANSSGTENTTGVGGSFSAITPAQLASALAAVATSTPMPSTSTSSFSPLIFPSPYSTSTPPSTISDPTPSSSTATPAGQIITHELFSQAMQQAFGATTQNQIQQLRNMGITDDALSMRALQITNGDVQAALELIFDMQQNERQNQ